MEKALAQEVRTEENVSPLVSVIVPVYCVEEYLGKCLESILQQTFRDFELILVDDGSTDRSGEICEEYKNKDSRIRVVHKENGGVSIARNTGIQQAKGQYITFIDSDDLVTKDFLESLYRPTFDLSLCGFRRVTVDGKTEKEYILETAEFTSRDAVDFKTLYEQSFMYSPWGKMFRTDIIKTNNVYFPEKVALGEDAMFVADYLMYVNTVSVQNCVGYIYIEYEGFDSLSSKISYDSLGVFTMSRDYAIERLEKISPEAALEVKKNAMSNAAWYIEVLVNSNMPLKKKKKILGYYLTNQYVKETLQDIERYYSSKKTIECLRGTTPKDILKRLTKIDRHKLMKKRLRGFLR